MTNQTQLLNRKWILALAVPAVAGLLAVGGCDDSSKTATPAGTGAGTAANNTMDNAGDAANNAMDKTGNAADNAMTNAGDAMGDKGPNDVKGMMGNDSKALAGVPDSVIEKLTSMSQTAAEKAEALKDQAKDQTVEGYGTGDAAVSKLGSINEAFDALKGGVEDRNFAEVTSSLTKLKGMNLTGELKTQFAGIVDAMKSANIPGIDKMMPGM